MTDGFLNCCKECVKIATAQHRQKNIDYCRQYDIKRNKTPRRKAKWADAQRRRRAEHPERGIANQKLERAIKKGLIIPQPCVICGDNAIGHHPDYQKPLEVIWLCKPHHSQLHCRPAFRAEIEQQYV